ncbi:threonine ammonia-lyase [bacterium]|nr:threonine ammonia-lyase [bacterium]
MSVDLKSIEVARKRISEHVLITPLIRSDAFAKLLHHDAPVFFKVETLQHTGSFKVRGAANKILSLLEQSKRPSKIVASSAGNHAQAVAYIASKVGIPSHIVMPEGAPLIKVSSTKAFGAEVELKGAYYDEAYKRALEICEADPKSVFVHPYKDEDIICGQGTLGIEVHQQLLEHKITGPIQAVIPIGGGGLFSGAATALRGLRPDSVFWGAVADAAPAMAESFKARKIVNAPVKGYTLADGLAVKTVSELNFDLIKDLASDVVSVLENDIAMAISVLMENRKLITEGAGATGVAAVLSRKIVLEPAKPVVFVLCGGNIDINKVSQIIEMGLRESRRWYKLGITVDDKPGELAVLTKKIAEAGANILEVHHNRSHSSCQLGKTYIEFDLETKGFEHAAKVEKLLRDKGIVAEEIK